MHLRVTQATLVDRASLHDSFGLHVCAFPFSLHVRYAPMYYSPVSSLPYVPHYLQSQACSLVVRHHWPAQELLLLPYRSELAQPSAVARALLLERQVRTHTLVHPQADTLPLAPCDLPMTSCGSQYCNARHHPSQHPELAVECMRSMGFRTRLR